MSKLVRDLIPDVIPHDRTHLYRFKEVSEDEYGRLLKQKLVEEVHEFLEAENVEELADIYEVIDALIKLKQFDKEQILQVQQKKRKKRGGFEKRLLMENVLPCTV